jgi:CheY-like chemotaxis protein
MTAPATKTQNRDSTTTSPNPPERRRRILIADDDAAIRSMLVELLRGEGFDTLEAKSGNEVLRTVPVEEPDLLLMDLRTGRHTNHETARRAGHQDSYRAHDRVRIVQRRH